MVAVSDDFNRANSTSSLGSTSVGSVPWTALLGTWGINSNTAYVSSGHASTTCFAVVEGSAADGTVTVTVTAADAVSNCGLLFRVTDVNNMYLLEGGSGSTTAKIYKRVAGTYTQLAQSAGNVHFGAGDVITLDLSGSSITAKRNGTTIVSLTDSTYLTPTKHGLYMLAPSGGTNGIRFDTFSITPADAAVTAVAATATTAGVAPALSAGSTITGVAATATAASVVPAVSGGSTVTSVKATASSAALPPTLTADATVTAVAATATAAAIEPVIVVPGDQTITPPAATASAEALPPSLAWDSTLSAAIATATATALVPVVSAGATVAAPAATATAAAPAPVAFAGNPDATVLAVPATATAAALAPTWTQVYDVDTDTSNMFDGLSMVGRATATVTRPAATPLSSLADKYDKAVAYPVPTMVNGRPT